LILAISALTTYIPYLDINNLLDKSDNEQVNDSLNTHTSMLSSNLLDPYKYSHVYIFLPNILTLLVLVNDLLSAGVIKEDATRRT